MHCTASPLTTHPPPSACWPAAWQHPDDGAADAAADAADGSMPGGLRWDMGGGRGADTQAKRCSRFRGRSWKGGNTEAAPLLWCWRELVSRSRNHVAAAPQVRCVRCIFAASAAMLGTLGLLWHTPAGSEARAKWLEVGAELHRDTPAIPTKPTSKTRWRDPRCSRQQRGAWQHGKLGSQPWVSSGVALGEARNSSITWIQDLETESRGPMSKTGRSWLLPRPSPSGSPLSRSV